MIPASTPGYTGVVVSNPANPRVGQAGSTVGQPLDAQGTVIATRMNVRFDIGGDIVAEDLADLTRL